MAGTKSNPKMVDLIGMVVGIIMLIVGAILVAGAKLNEFTGTFQAQPPGTYTHNYLLTVGTAGVFYAVLLAVGFVILVTFLHLYVEDRAA